MSTALLNLDGIIDLNSIFTLNYNFDYLKMILEALIHANKATNEKMKEFQVSLNEKDNKIQEYIYFKISIIKTFHNLDWKIS